MDLLFQSLRIKLYQSDHDLLLFDEEISRLENILRSLVFAGESNSLLILGRRGSGKKRLVSQALANVRKDLTVKQNLLEVHLNGLVHTSDLSALRSMAKQLHREPLLDNFDPEGSTHKTEEIKMHSFSQQLRLFLDDVSNGKDTSKCLLIVLHEFDLFAMHRNQILLYNLFDCCQSSANPICVIGLTCRLDIMELLEKRVKSRFSHRQIHLYPIAAPLGTPSCSTNPDNDESTALAAFNVFRLACKNMLTVKSDYVLSTLRKSITAKERLELNSSIASWNQHVSDLMEDEIVVDSLRQAWSVSVSLRRLNNLLVPIVSKLGPTKTRIEPVEFIDSICLLQQDAKISLLQGLSVLELFLLVTLVKLHEIRDGRPANFELLYVEYSKFCRANCPAYLYDKAVVFKLLDNLIDLELVVCGKAALNAAATSAVGRNVPSGATTLPNYRPLYCFVDEATLSECLDVYPNCPTELRFWIRSRTF